MKNNTERQELLEELYQDKTTEELQALAKRKRLDREWRDYVAVLAHDTELFFPSQPYSAFERDGFKGFVVWIHGRAAVVFRGKQVYIGQPMGVSGWMFSEEHVAIAIGAISQDIALTGYSTYSDC